MNSPRTRTLRLLTANIQAGSSTRRYSDYVTRSWSHALPAGRKRSSLDAIATLARDHDIVGLQEADPGSLRSGFTNQTHYLAAGLLVALVSSAIPMSLEMMALKRLPKETFGILISMEPAVAALWAMLLLHEHLHGLQWLAIGCTVLASVGYYGPLVLLPHQG